MIAKDIIQNIYNWAKNKTNEKLVDPLKKWNKNKTKDRKNHEKIIK